MRTVHRNIHLLTGLAGALLASHPALAGPEWAERAGSDAGKTPSTAGLPIGAGTLGKISGMLSGTPPFGVRGADGPGGTGDFQDMFLIRIAEPQLFTATVDPAGGGDADFDTQLWLFRFDGRGLLGNDDAAPGAPFSALGRQSTDGSGAQIMHSGLYYLAISGAPSTPFSATGPIFEFVDPSEVSGPDGPGGSNPIEDWDANGATGSYEIILTGVEFGSCAADLTQDGSVGFADLNAMLGAWGPCPPPLPPNPCPPDLNADGNVGFFDLSLLLDMWGACPVNR